MHHSRALATALAFAITFTATDAMALGVGSPVLGSHLDEPLVARLPLVDTGRLDARAVTVSLADEAAFAHAGLSRSAATDTLKINVQGKPGALYVALSGTHALRKPWLELVLDIHWPGGRLTPTVTLLPAPIGSSDASSTTQTGDATSAPTTAQTAMALYRANPDAFTDGRVDQLQAGVQLSTAHLEHHVESAERASQQLAALAAPASASPASAPSVAVAGKDRARPQQAEPNTTDSAMLRQLGELTSRVDQLMLRVDRLADQQQQVNQELPPWRPALEALRSDQRRLESQLSEAIRHKASTEPPDSTRPTVSPAAAGISNGEAPTERWWQGIRKTMARWLGHEAELSWFALGGLLIVLSMLIVWRHRRARRDGHGDSMAMLTASGQASTLPDTLSDPDVEIDKTLHETHAAPEVLNIPQKHTEAVSQETMIPPAESVQASPSPPEAAATTVSAAETPLDARLGEAALTAEAGVIEDARVFIAHGRLKQARALLEGELATYPDHAETRLQLMAVLVSLGEHDAFERHADHFDDDPAVSRRIDAMRIDMTSEVPVPDEPVAEVPVTTAPLIRKSPPMSTNVATRRPESAALQALAEDRPAPAEPNEVARTSRILESSIDFSAMTSTVAEAGCIDLSGQALGEAEPAGKAPSHFTDDWSLEEVAFTLDQRDNGSSKVDDDCNDRLVRAHVLLEADDQAGARPLLDRVLAEGSAEARVMARSLMARFDLQESS